MFLSLDLRVCFCLIKAPKGVSLLLYLIRYQFCTFPMGPFLSLGVQKCSFRGTDKKVQKCTYDSAHTLIGYSWSDKALVPF